MPLSRDIVLLGLSHRTAPIALRERCAVLPASLSEALARLKRESGSDECWVLSTCNRTEVVAVCANGTNASKTLARALFAEVGFETHDALYVHHGVEAVFHLFRVAAGLDSQVLGESQIVYQIKAASRAAKEAGTLGGVLAPLLDQALITAKRVRTETRLGEGTLSVARAAVELAHKVLGNFARISALVVGAGETGILVAKHLFEAGVKHLHFANRNLARAEDAAQLFGGEAHDLTALSSLLPRVDLTLVSVDVREPLIRPEHIDAQRLRRHDRPPILIDLSIPRAVDPVLKRHQDILVHDLDDLESIVTKHRAEREAEIEAAGKILVEDVHKFFALRTYSAFKPVIQGLVERFEEIRLEVLEQVGSGGHTGAGRLSEILTRRLLDETLSRLKEGARQTLSAEQLGRRYQSHVSRS